MPATFGYSAAAAATAAAPATPAPHSPGPFVAPAPRGRPAEAPPVMPAGPPATAPGPGPASQRGLRASAGGHYVDEMATVPGLLVAATFVGGGGGKSLSHFGWRDQLPLRSEAPEWLKACAGVVGTQFSEWATTF